MLAGADYLKMGYVSRNHSKDNVHHFVLGTILYRPADFATQVSLSLVLSASFARSLLLFLSSALSLFFLSHADILRSLAHVSCFSSPLILHCPAVVVTHVSSLCGVLNEREDTLKRPPIVCAFAIRAFYIRRRET